MKPTKREEMIKTIKKICARLDEPELHLVWQEGMDLLVKQIRRERGIAEPVARGNSGVKSGQEKPGGGGDRDRKS
jgi:hypothetical protein